MVVESVERILRMWKIKLMTTYKIRYLTLPSQALSIIRQGQGLASGRII